MAQAVSLIFVAGAAFLNVAIAYAAVNESLQRSSRVTNNLSDIFSELLLFEIIRVVFDLTYVLPQCGVLFCLCWVGGGSALDGVTWSLMGISSWAEYFSTLQLEETKNNRNQYLKIA